MLNCNNNAGFQTKYVAFDQWKIEELILPKTRMSSSEVTPNAVTLSLVAVTSKIFEKVRIIRDGQLIPSHPVWGVGRKHSTVDQIPQ